MCALAVSHLTVTLRMISNNRRSFSSIGAVHVQYDSFFNRYVTPWMKNSSVMLLTGWLPPFLRTFVIGTVTATYLIYWQVSIDHWCGSVAVTHHSELLSYEKPSRRVFLELEHKKTLKTIKNVLRQHQILLICLLVPIIAILNLVTLSL